MTTQVIFLIAKSMKAYRTQ